MIPSFPAHVLADALAPSIARWSLQRERQILREGRPLSPELLAFAELLGIDHPEDLRLEIRSRIPLPIPDELASLAQRLGLPVFQPAGMALGRAISAISSEAPLLRHELVHVLQYQRFGSHQAFMTSYLFECLHYGYFEAPLEREARETSSF